MTTGYTISPQQQKQLNEHNDKIMYELDNREIEVRLLVETNIFMLCPLSRVGLKSTHPSIRGRGAALAEGKVASM